MQPHGLFSSCKLHASSPAELSIHQNAYTLARYAVICQENGLVRAAPPPSAAAARPL
jgi:fructose-bisphosphate aldolase class 1